MVITDDQQQQRAADRRRIGLELTVLSLRRLYARLATDGNRAGDAAAVRLTIELLEAAGHEQAGSEV